MTIPICSFNNYYPNYCGETAPHEQWPVTHQPRERIQDLLQNLDSHAGSKQKHDHGSISYARYCIENTLDINPECIGHYHHWPCGQQWKYRH